MDALFPWLSSKLATTAMPNCETLVIDFDVLIIVNPFKVAVFDDCLSLVNKANAFFGAF